jgi:chromate transport protein ChrA
MLILIIGFFSIKDNPYMIAAIKGVRPFVVGLLAWTAYEIAIPVFGLDKQWLGASLIHGWDKWLIALGTFLVLTFTSLSPIWLVLVAAGIGLIFYR